jgi:methylmalonyl-CoA mutase
MTEENVKLSSEFPPISPQEWIDKITVDLKGAPYDKKMIWNTGEGFKVNPFYTDEDIEGLSITTSLPNEFPFVRGTKIDNNWLIRQDIDVISFKDANSKAKKLLAESGVNSLGFSFHGDKVKKENIAALLDGICPEETELNFVTCNKKSAGLIDILVEIFRSKGADLSKCKGSVAYNPFKAPLIKGIPIEVEWVDDALSLIKKSDSLSGYQVLAVNAYLLNDAGSYITQELGFALSWGNEIISKLTEKGVSSETAAKKVKFNFGISSDYFLEIGKFRAARWLWAEIVKAYNPAGDVSDACKMQVNARTSSWNMTMFDPNVNLLRTQTESMSAAIAGVDSITVLPYDKVFKQPDEFSERIARNQQLLLKEECHFDKVVDPSAGSYYIEVLTKSIADAAWSLFLEIDDKGGFGVVVDKGEVQSAVNKSNSERKKQVATRRLTLLGTNQFPNFTEKIKTKIDSSKPDSCCDDKKGEIEKLNFTRGASEFEKLRLETENNAKQPKIFMLTIGNLAMRLARSQFSSNFFACAGYSVIDNLGFKTIEEGVNAAREKGADIIVVCSSDDEYVTFGPEAYNLTKGKELLVIAGAPACTEELKAAGIEHFINVKSNVLETLRMFNKLLGISN